MSTDKDAPGQQQPSPDPPRTRRRRRIDTEALLHDIYECALHPDGWDRTLTQIRQYLNASAINLIGLEMASYGNPFLFTSNIPIDYGKDYQRHWYHEDPWVLGARSKRLNRGGETLTGGMLADRRELKRSAFFHDWLAYDWLVGQAPKIGCGSSKCTRMPITRGTGFPRTRTNP